MEPVEVFTVPVEVPLVVLLVSHVHQYGSQWRLLGQYEQQSPVVVPVLVPVVVPVDVAVVWPGPVVPLVPTVEVLEVPCSRGGTQHAVRESAASKEAVSEFRRAMGRLEG